MGFEKRGVDSVQKMSDDANRKNGLLNAVRRIPPDLFLKNGFEDEDIDTFHGNLEKRLLKRSMTVAPHELRELTTEVLRDTMVRLGIKSPGFEDDFREALDEMIRIDTHA